MTCFGDRLTLAEGAVVERLRRDPRVQLDRHLAHAAFIYQPEAARILAEVLRQYMDIGAAAGLPMVSFTPTWRANPERLFEAGLEQRDVNGDAARFLQGIRTEYGDYAKSISIGGLIGCRGDCYRPEEALAPEEAAKFHREQCRKLAEAGVDFLFAATLPAASEGLGIAHAMSGLGVPYMLSFVLNPDGRLMDGTRLDEAISMIDAAVSNPPAGYCLNCVHHSTAARALEQAPKDALSRILGLQANTSAKSHQELDGSATLHTEDPDVFADGMADLHRRFGLKILGGCCGTDDRHIQALAGRISKIQGP
jgi:homocysteine S-methyltransferase